jgi:hypothetical protein
MNNKKQQKSQMTKEMTERTSTFESLAKVIKGKLKIAIMAKLHARDRLQKIIIPANTNWLIW